MPRIIPWVLTVAALAALHPPAPAKADEPADKGPLPPKERHALIICGHPGDVACREQVFVMTMSLSGYFVAPLSRRDRVVIAATEADAETNETKFPAVFAQFLAAGLDPAEHDVDKDGKLSLFDLYVVVAKE